MGTKTMGSELTRLVYLTIGLTLGCFIGYTSAQAEVVRIERQRRFQR